MSGVRFSAAIATIVPTIELNPDVVLEGSSAQATLTTHFVQSIPIRHYVWVYNLAGVKVDVIA
jgi:hypothetical protein